MAPWGPERLLNAEIAWPLSDGWLTIRPASVADADAFFEYQQRPEGQRYISRIPATIEDARAMVAERTSTAGALMCAIVVDGQVVGDIGGRRYRPGSLGPEPEAWDFRLGYSVHPGMWGRGVASAAVGLFVPALHQQAGIRRIVAKVFADNQASIRVLRRTASSSRAPSARRFSDGTAAGWTTAPWPTFRDPSCSQADLTAAPPPPPSPHPTFGNNRPGRKVESGGRKIRERGFDKTEPRGAD